MAFCIDFSERRIYRAKAAGLVGVFWQAAHLAHHLHLGVARRSWVFGREFEPFVGYYKYGLGPLVLYCFCDAILETRVVQA